MRFVPAASLKEGMILGRDIINTSHAFMLKKGVVLTPDYVTYLNEKGYLGAYITDVESMEVEPQEVLTPERVLAGVEAVEACSIGDIIRSAKDIVEGVSALDNLSVDLLDLRSFDDYTYHHSVNVAVYAVAVGKYLGLSEDELTLLSQAGICHDLGKSKIPLSIINKPGRLTDEEFAEMKNHSRYSYEILSGNPEISAVVRQAVLFHHENENGSGYPMGKEGDKIPMFAKIIHSVDVFDALTSKRPYKDPFSPSDAFDYLFGGKGILFSGHVVDAMCSVIPAYPPGIDVGLSNGEEALVVGQTGNPTRPLIKITDGRRVNLLADSLYRDVFITSSGILPADYDDNIGKQNEDRQAVKVLRKKIMLVDDSIINLKQMMAALPEELYQLVPVQSGIAAINYIRTRGVPDLMIIDVDMPVMGGLTTLKNLKKQGLGDMPVIFMAAMADRDTVMNCRLMGATDFMIKPAKPTYLRERVALALDANLDRL